MTVSKPLRAGILNGYRFRQFIFTHHSYATTVTQPRVQPTRAVGQPLPTFSGVVGDPIPNAPRLEVVCPRPTHPLPKWIDTASWEDEERLDSTPSLTSNVNSTDWENSGKELDGACQSLPTTYPHQHTVRDGKHLSDEADLRLRRRSGKSLIGQGA